MVVRRELEQGARALTLSSHFPLVLFKLELEAPLLVAVLVPVLVVVVAGADAAPTRPLFRFLPRNPTRALGRSCGSHSMRARHLSSAPPCDFFFFF